jgi:hypothetical protein
VRAIKSVKAHRQIAIQHDDLKVSLFSQHVDSNVLLVSGKRKVNARLSYPKVSDRYLLEEIPAERALKTLISVPNPVR